VNSLNNQSWKVSAAETDTRLDKWLAAPDRLGSRSKSLSAIEHGKVFINDVEQTTADAGRKLQPGETVRLWMDRPGSAARRYTERRASGLHLLYEDSSLLVINKPVGLLSVPLPSQPDEESLFDQVKFHLRSHNNRDPLVVHRIDRDTSGLIVFAKTGEAQHKLKEQFERREPERVYLVAVHGHPEPESGIWKDLLEWDQEELKQHSADHKDRFTKQATSRYKVVEKFAHASLVEIRLVTGKRNQIRIQAGLRGYPVIGERMYVYDPPPDPKIEFNRQALHAFQLGFKHPVDRRPLKFEAPLPADFVALLERLRKPAPGKPTTGIQQASGKSREKSN
jgi:23S rRNA pseudouridine1911/1915/1917 synthase